MLVLNNGEELIIFGTEELFNEFCEKYLANAYNDDTRKGFQLYVDHFKEAFEADKRLTKMVQEKIANDIVPIVILGICNWCDLDAFQFKAVSTIEDRKVLKREELEFYEYCDICFGHIQGLMSKLIREFGDK